MGITGHLRRRAAQIAVAALVIALSPAQAIAGPDSATEAAVAAKVEASLVKTAKSTEKMTFWVRFDAKANLTQAVSQPTKAQRGAAVLAAKTAIAESSQAQVRTLLDKAGADYESFWISNAIKVTGASKLLADLAVRPEVKAITADELIALPKPIRESSTSTTVNAVEWNVDRINAPQVWDQFGRGEGIVVANIDTGVALTHPALADKYRGRAADGTLDHNYNWFDPSSVCPTAAPCDNNNHGTHTMGTMVGEDGANQIGVAPGATWIAAKGCESSSCSLSALLASGQWMVAPTDLTGANPRPDLAPDIVNNSWGGTGFDPFYQDIVNSWVAAGIFPAFSNGNSGPSCNTSGSPGMYVASYSSGAFDINNAIANFSSRGAGENGDIKPNLAAPGVNIRSSVADGGYSNFSGTSMASPHTAAVVALMWSASPTLRGDISATRTLLDEAAIDVDDTTCGGTAADNNVFGEGRLDAYAAVSNAPIGPTGSLSGTITSDGSPLAGVSVSVDGPNSRSTTTDADGTYHFQTLSVGDYTVTASKFGYLTFTGSATITDGQTTVLDGSLAAAPSATVTGTVSSASGPAADAPVRLVGTPVETSTDAQGQFSFTAPVGDYQLAIGSPNRCADPVTQPLSLTGDTTLNITLPHRQDSFGYTCAASDQGYPELTTPLALTGDDATTTVELPFQVPLYGEVYNSAVVSTNGTVGLAAGSSSLSNVSIPSTSAPNGALYPFWDDLVVDASSGMYTGVVGDAPHRWFAIEWRDVRFYSDTTQRMSFVAMLNEDGTVLFRYKDVADTGRETGNSATIGVENAAGTVAFQYSYNEAAVTDGLAVEFRSARHGVVRGKVTDANDGLALADASVSLSSEGTVVGETTSAADGTWIAQVPAGDLTATVSAAAYETQTRSVSLGGGDVAVLDMALRTAKVVANPGSLRVVTPSGQDRTRTVTVKNVGGLPTAVSLAEVGGDVPWLSAELGATTLEPGASTTLTVTVDARGMTGGAVEDAVLRISSDSGRAPQLDVPVKLVVPGFMSALDAGSRTGHVDAAGDAWAPDQKFAIGACGYLGSSSTVKTRKNIGGTDDQRRFADARTGMYEYRCDGLDSGVYTVELGFAELSRLKPNKRVFDVMVEGTEVLPNLDIALEAGNYNALTKTYTVNVTDGQLNIRFITHSGFGKPIVSSVRVIHRPDLS